MITRDLIASLAPRPANKAKREIWDAYVEALLSSETQGRLGLAGVNTENRLSHLLAQWLHESGGFTVLWEDMHYSSKRILAVFGPGKHSAAVPPGEAVRLANSPEPLAERVYGLGNPKKAAELGNRDPGDGYRFRGFGIGQITGRRDHERLLGGQQTAQASINAAIQEWTEKGCNACADKDDLEAVTKKINGGLNNFEDRKMWLARCKAAVAGCAFEGQAPQRSVVAEKPPEADKPAPAELGAKVPAQTAEPAIVTREAEELNPPSVTPSLPSVAVRSKSIWALFNAKILLVLGFLTELGREIFDWIGRLFGAVPQAASDSIGLVEQGQKLSGLAGFNWQKISFSVALVCLAVAMVRHLRDKRELETLRGKS